jgi:hypothetical protein
MAFPSSLRHLFVNLENTNEDVSNLQNNVTTVSSTRSNFNYVFGGAAIPSSFQHALPRLEIANEDVTEVSPTSSENYLIFDKMVITAKNNTELQQNVCKIISEYRSNVYKIIIRTLVIKGGYNDMTFNFHKLSKILYKKFETIHLEVAGHYSSNILMSLMAKEIETLSWCAHDISNA